MATSKEFKEYVAEKLGPMGKISIRPMMGEFLLYFNGKLFGGIYDGRVLIKVASTNEKFGLQKEIPYAGAKPMLRLADLENFLLAREIVLATCEGLPDKKK